MNELKDIKLKEGDLIIIEDGNRRWVVNSPFFSVLKTDRPENINFFDKIIKIERPVKYETIYKAPKPILDKEEKEYLEKVIRPFKDKVLYIQKICSCVPRQKPFEVIWIQLINDELIKLPRFKPNTMYKGMERCREYTLKELGLFE